MEDELISLRKELARVRAAEYEQRSELKRLRVEIACCDNCCKLAGCQSLEPTAPSPRPTATTASLTETETERVKSTIDSELCCGKELHDCTAPAATPLAGTRGRITLEHLEQIRAECNAEVRLPMPSTAGVVLRVRCRGENDHAVHC